MELTKFGVWVGRLAADEAEYGEAARLAEDLGFGALWLGGSPRLPKLRPMLEATDTIVIATGIVNIWQYEPAELADEFAVLEADFPGRVLLGIGIGHPEATQEYEKPLTKTRRLPRRHRGLGASGAARAHGRWPHSARRCSTSASSARSGRTPTSRRPAHTRFARERLGRGALVAPEQAVVIDDDPD